MNNQVDKNIEIVKFEDFNGDVRAFLEAVKKTYHLDKIEQDTDDSSNAEEIAKKQQNAELEAKWEEMRKHAQVSDELEEKNRSFLRSLGCLKKEQRNNK